MGHVVGVVRWFARTTTRGLPRVWVAVGPGEVYFDKQMQTAGAVPNTPARAPDTWTRVGYPTYNVLVYGSFTASNGVPVVAGSTVPGPGIPGTGTIGLFFVPRWGRSVGWGACGGGYCIFECGYF